jgi:hypothetical protein
MKNLNSLSELIAFLQEIETNEGDLLVKVTTEEEPRLLTPICDISLVNSNLHGLYVLVEV